MSGESSWDQLVTRIENRDTCNSCVLSPKRDAFGEYMACINCGKVIL